MVTVVTTIQHATPAMLTLAESAAAVGEPVIIVADLRTPTDFHLDGAVHLSVDAQRSLASRTAELMPYNSYARKNIGYLRAIELDAEVIRETDDDNFVSPGFFTAPHEGLVARLPEASLFLNPYAYFDGGGLWPRGYPLDLVLEDRVLTTVPSEVIPGRTVFQGLADGEPDVDAVFRMTRGGRDVTFADAGPLRIPSGSYAPFNSQATCWERETWPLLYLPSTCSFRMTDIWRGYIAQRVLHATGGSLVFTSAVARQDRNPHNLMADFRDEIEGYLGYHRFVDALEETAVESADDVGEMLRMLYARLIDERFFEPVEMERLGGWLDDLAALGAAVRA
jgi:hypothetical protein